MAEEQYTRCPGCRTVFRVTPAQLALREGQVRCGHCRTVFDGNASLISLAPRARPGPEDDASTGPLTVTLRSAQALEPADTTPVTPVGAVGASAASAAASAATASPAAATEPREPVDYDHRFAWDRPQARSGRRTVMVAAAIAALLLLFVVQVGWHFRDALAAHLPSTRPMLNGMCEVFGCTVRPLREIAGLSIDASDLQADPAHKGLLTLSATVRNRARYAVAYPHLELTLTDAQDQAVVRRALAPEDYTRGVADLSIGIPGNGEVAVKLFIDASATTQAAYRVYLFYP